MANGTLTVLMVLRDLMIVGYDGEIDEGKRLVAGLRDQLAQDKRAIDVIWVPAKVEPAEPIDFDRIRAMLEHDKQKRSTN